MRRAIVLYDFGLSLLFESAGWDGFYLWQDAKKSGDIGCAIYHSCLFFVLFGAFVSVMPGTSKYMNGSVMPLFAKPVDDILCSIFYDAGSGSPCAFQLWFLRDLILIVATSPLWYICLKFFRWGFVAIAFGLTYPDVFYVPFYALFWFVLGGQLTKVEAVVRGGRNASLKIEIIVLNLFFTFSMLQLFFPHMFDWELLRVPIILLGIIGVWGLYDIVAGKEFCLTQHRWLATVCQFTFFIYLFHEPTLNVVRKLLVVVLGKNEIGYLASYLVSPWIFTVCAVLVGLLFRKYFPKVYGICTGGR